MPDQYFKLLNVLKGKEEKTCVIHFFSEQQLNLVEKVSEHLQEIVGMATLKEQILKWTKSVHLDRKRSESAGKHVKGKVDPPIYHMVLMGNPGTGKTNDSEIASKYVIESPKGIHWEFYRTEMLMRVTFKKVETP